MARPDGEEASTSPLTTMHDEIVQPDTATLPILIYDMQCACVLILHFPQQLGPKETRCIAQPPPCAQLGKERSVWAGSDSGAVRGSGFAKQRTSLIPHTVPPYPSIPAGRPALRPGPSTITTTDLASRYPPPTQYTRPSLRFRPHCYRKPRGPTPLSRLRLRLPPLRPAYTATQW